MKVMKVGATLIDPQRGGKPITFEAQCGPGGPREIFKEEAILHVRPPGGTEDGCLLVVNPFGYGLPHFMVLPDLEGASFPASPELLAKETWQLMCRVQSQVWESMSGVLAPGTVIFGGNNVAPLTLMSHPNNESPERPIRNPGQSILLPHSHVFASAETTEEGQASHCSHDAEANRLWAERLLKMLTIPAGLTAAADNRGLSITSSNGEPVPTLLRETEFVGFLRQASGAINTLSSTIAAGLTGNTAPTWERIQSSLLHPPAEEHGGLHGLSTSWRQQTSPRNPPNSEDPLIRALLKASQKEEITPRCVPGGVIGLTGEGMKIGPNLFLGPMGVFELLHPGVQLLRGEALTGAARQRWVGDVIRIANRVSSGLTNQGCSVDEGLGLETLRREERGETISAAVQMALQEANKQPRQPAVV